jgi:hypothetical protein
MVSHEVRLEPVRLDIKGDEDGRLVLVDGKLAAVVACLGAEHHEPHQRGAWHLEAAFGRFGLYAAPPLFADLDDVVAWAAAAKGR